MYTTFEFHDTRKIEYNAIKLKDTFSKKIIYKNFKKAHACVEWDIMSILYDGKVVRVTSVHSNGFLYCRSYLFRVIRNHLSL